MKKMLIITAAAVALCAGLPHLSLADETLTNMSEANVEVVLVDMQRRIQELESKVGGEIAGSTFQARGPKVRHLRQSTQAFRD